MGAIIPKPCDGSALGMAAEEVRSRSREKVGSSWLKSSLGVWEGGKSALLDGSSRGRLRSRLPPRLLDPITHSWPVALQRAQGVVTTPSTVGRWQADLRFLQVKHARLVRFSRFSSLTSSTGPDGSGLLS